MDTEQQIHRSPWVRSSVTTAVFGAPSCDVSLHVLALSTRSSPKVLECSSPQRLLCQTSGKTYKCKTNKLYAGHDFHVVLCFRRKSLMWLGRTWQEGKVHSQLRTFCPLIRNIASRCRSNTSSKTPLERNNTMKDPCLVVKTCLR
eukprot:2993191-Amphidinium_carterae.1